MKQLDQESLEALKKMAAQPDERIERALEAVNREDNPKSLVQACILYLHSKSRVTQGVTMIIVSNTNIGKVYTVTEPLEIRLMTRFMKEIQEARQGRLNQDDNFLDITLTI